VLEFIAKNINTRHMIDSLAKSSRAWAVPKDGVLAKAIGVSSDKVEALAEEVLSTFKQRFEGVRLKGRLLARR
jgi:hypothetical protein